MTSYSWDVLNRLTAIDFADGTSAAYRYDAQGRRIEKAVNGALTRYVYDDDAILLEYGRGNRLQARYSHGEEIDQPLVMARGGQSWFYQVDHLGSVRLLTDASGAIVSRYDYDAFGNLESSSFEGVTNPYAFTARERDAESGLMFYRARYYDPMTGRFISEDPIGFEAGDLNVYRYVFNSTLGRTDPSGESIISTITAYKTQIVAATIAFGGVYAATGDLCFAGLAALTTIFAPAVLASLQTSFISNIFLRIAAEVGYGLTVAIGGTQVIRPQVCNS